MKIGVFGSGYVGLVTGSCLADLGHEVFCVDVDENKINSLKNGEITFYEPGLKELVKRTTDKGRLKFSTSAQECIEFSEVIFNCVGTPRNEDGSANLTYIFQVVESVKKYSNGFKVLINKSTVPPGTAKRCQELLENTSVKVVSNPEFLKEGNAVHDFTHPDMIIVGSQDEGATAIVKKMYSGLIRPYFQVIETNWESSEMIKYANNCFLATKISFINEIANICDKVGADVKTVARAIGKDYRISPKFLNPGVGYGGSCFPKDIRALVNVAKQNGYDAKLLQEVDLFNKRQKKIILQKVETHFGVLRGKSFSIWGLSFKPKTSDIREAPSLLLIEELLQKGALVNVYDPVAMDEVRKIFFDKISYHTSAENSAKGTDAIILVTEWDEFRGVNFSEIGKTMNQKILFDGRNIYQPEQTNGFTYYGVGRK